jgi:TPR repeat protein
MSLRTEFLDLPQDVFPSSCFPSLTREELMHFRATCHFTRNLFSTRNSDSHFQQRVKSEFKVDVTQDNALDKYAVFCLFAECLKTIPYHDEYAKIAFDIANQRFAALKEKILSFELQDPFFLSWGNYFLAFINFYGYGVEEKDAGLEKARAHLEAAAQHGNTKAMLILALAFATEGGAITILRLNPGIESHRVFTVFNEVGVRRLVLAGEEDQGLCLNYLQRAFDLQDPEAIELVTHLYTSRNIRLFSCQRDEDFIALLTLGVRKGSALCALLLARNNLDRLNNNEELRGDFQENLTPGSSSKEKRVRHVAGEFEKAALMGSTSAVEFLLGFYRFPQLIGRSEEMNPIFEDQEKALSFCLEKAKKSPSFAEGAAYLYEMGNALFPGAIHFTAEKNVFEAIRYYKLLVNQFLFNEYAQTRRTDWFSKLMTLHLNPALPCFNLEEGLRWGNRGVEWESESCAAYLGWLYFFGNAKLGIAVDKEKADHYFSLATVFTFHSKGEFQILAQLKNHSNNADVFLTRRECIKWILVALRQPQNNADNLDILLGKASYVLFQFSPLANKPGYKKLNQFDEAMPYANELLQLAKLPPIDETELELKIMANEKLTHASRVRR